MEPRTRDDVEQAVGKYKAQLVLSTPGIAASELAAKVQQERQRLIAQLPGVRAVAARAQAAAQGLNQAAITAAGEKEHARAAFIDAGGTPQAFEAAWPGMVRQRQTEAADQELARRRAALARQVRAAF